MGLFFAVVLTLFFTIDSVGMIPSYISAFKMVEKRRRRWVEVRELIFALIIMILFHYVGRWVLSLLSLSRTTVEISGGMVLFLIAIRLIFQHEDEKETTWGGKGPFVVPIATPLIASPQVLAIIMIYSMASHDDLFILEAIFFAWLASCIILLFAGPIFKVLTIKGIIAVEKLMGLIMALIAIGFIMGALQRLTFTG